MIAYKFLSPGGVGLFSRFAWPQPTSGEPGPWVSVDGELVPCTNGVHACDAASLVEWLDDELWRVELADPVSEANGMLISRSARLLERVDAWDEARARGFVATCVARIAELAQARNDDPSLVDLERLARGSRPDLSVDPPSASEGGPTPGALAANLGFVSAHVAALLAEGRGDPGGYDAGFEAERRRQSEWLLAELAL